MSVASAVYERTCHVCDAVRLYFQRAIIQMQRGRQLSANQKIMREMKKNGKKIHHKEGTGKTGWILLDYFGLCVHILLDEKRNNYDLESLWSSAREIVRIH